MRSILSVAMAIALVAIASPADAGRSKRCCVTAPSCGVPVALQPCPTPEACLVQTSRTVTVTRQTSCDGATCRSRTTTAGRTVTASSTTSAATGDSSAQPSLARASLAQWKAEQLARRGQLVHLGGGFGGGSFEGIGYGPTPEQATRSCCFWGQRTPIDIGVASGPGGYYAVVLYR